MAFEFVATDDAFPDILVFNLITMFRRNLDTEVSKSDRGLAAPGLEVCAMRLVANLADHEGGEVAEFVSEYVVEAILVVDDFFRELNGAVVADLESCVGGEGTGAEAELLSAPVCAAGCGFEGFGPDEFDAAGWGG